MNSKFNQYTFYGILFERQEFLAFGTKDCVLTADEVLRASEFTYKFFLVFPVSGLIMRFHALDFIELFLEIFFSLAQIQFLQHCHFLVCFTLALVKVEKPFCLTKLLHEILTIFCVDNFVPVILEIFLLLSTNELFGVILFHKECVLLMFLFSSKSNNIH